MIANLIAHLRRLGRQRLRRRQTQRQLAELRRRRTMLEADLSAMQHWPETAQQRMQAQIDALDKRIEFMESIEGQQ